MRRRTFVVFALILVFALMFTACATRRPLQTPAQPRQNTTGLYDNNRGVGTGTGTTTGAGTRTGVGTGYNYPYDARYGIRNNGMGYGGYNGYYGYGTANNAGYGGAETPSYYGGTTGYGNYNNGMYGGNVGYGGYGGYGYDYRNTGGSNASGNYGLNNTAGTTQAGRTTQADGIERSLEQIAGVDNATVVVSGNTAYVGLDTGGDDRGTNVGYGPDGNVAALKRSCAQRVRAADPNIKTVYVSTDNDFSNRLRRVGEGIRTGSPVSTFRNELDALIRGLTPDRR